MVADITYFRTFTPARARNYWEQKNPLGAHSVKYLSGLWSTKMVIWDPNTMSLKWLNAQITAYASRSIVAHAH